MNQAQIKIAVCTKIYVLCNYKLQVVFQRCQESFRVFQALQETTFFWLQPSNGTRKRCRYHRQTFRKMLGNGGLGRGCWAAQPQFGHSIEFCPPVSRRNIRDVLEKLAVTAVRKSWGKDSSHRKLGSVNDAIHL